MLLTALCPWSPHYAQCSDSGRLLCYRSYQGQSLGSSGPNKTGVAAVPDTPIKEIHHSEKQKDSTKEATLGKASDTHHTP